MAASPKKTKVYTAKRQKPKHAAQSLAANKNNNSNLEAASLHGQVSNEANQAQKRTSPRFAMFLEGFAVLAVLGLVLWILNRPFAAPAASRAKLNKQAFIVHTPNEGDVYRSLEVKNGSLLTEPFPGVRTLHDIFL